MSRLNDIQDEIEILKAELKFRRTLGMATSDILDRIDKLEKEESNELLNTGTISDKILERIKNRKRKYGEKVW